MRTYSCVPAAIIGLLCSVAHSADATSGWQPRIFWASSPVRPDETVLVQGSDFGPNAIVEMARLDDTTKETPERPA